MTFAGSLMENGMIPDPRPIRREVEEAINRYRLHRNGIAGNQSVKVEEMLDHALAELAKAKVMMFRIKAAYADASLDIPHREQIMRTITDMEWDDFGRMVAETILQAFRTFNGPDHDTV